MGCTESKMSQRSQGYRMQDDKGLSKSKKAKTASGELTGRTDSSGSQDKGKAKGKRPAGPPPSRCSFSDQRAPLTAPPTIPAAKLDPKDFAFVGLRNETKVKPPGSIGLQQFVIDGCHGCDLYLMDACDTVTVDDCTDCRIFVGPTDSSVFLRDCSRCSFAVVSRQLRTRGLDACQLLLHCRTRPIIEDTRGLEIGCLAWPYPGLDKQLAAVRISIFTNHWSHIYDFTPAPGNWSFLEPGVGVEELMGGLPQQLQLLLSADVAGRSCSGPFVTWGNRPRTGSAPGARSSAAAAAATTTSLVVLLPADRRQVALDLIPSSSSGRNRGGSGNSSAGGSGSSSGGGSGSSGGGGSGSSSAAASSSGGNSYEAGALCTPSGTGSAAKQQPPGALKLLLLYTNETTLTIDTARHLAESAGWDRGAAAALAKGMCVGLEIGAGSAGDLDEVEARARQLGAFTCRSEEVAKAFRYLGVEG